MDTTTELHPLVQLPHVIESARSLPTEQGILSVYLDTSSMRALNSAHRLTFRDLCEQLRAEMGDAASSERRDFENTVANVDEQLAKRSPLNAPGIALFATPASDEPLVTLIPHRTIDRVTWAKQPVLVPLEEVMDELERVAVLLFDKEQSRLFSIFLGEIEDRKSFHNDVPGKQATGDWFALSQKRYQRHHEDHVMRHAKRTIRALSDQLRKRPFDRLFIAGPDEAIATLTHLLPVPLQIRLAGTLSVELFASDAEVLAAALAAAESVERAEEVEEVKGLIDSQADRHVALGADRTLEALSQGRAHVLYIASGIHGSGSWCDACNRLSTPVATCPTCGGATEPVSDVEEMAISMAVDQGARLEIVSGEAADLLLAIGGFGARTRY
jgi:peptide subunit release factor 1 (eRF1)